MGESQLPPRYDVTAESALIGALFVNPDIASEISGIVRPEMFAVQGHGTIFGKIMELARGGRTVSPPSLAIALASSPDLAALGGPSYLSKLAFAAVPRATAMDYARMVADLWLYRRVADFGKDLAARAEQDESLDPVGLLVAAEKQLSGLGSGLVGEGPPEFSALMDEAVEAAKRAARGEKTGVATGFQDLDELLGRMQPYELLIIAGRPSMGKTAIALNIALNVATAGIPVLFFSLEMSDKQLALRQLASRAGFSGHSVRAGILTFDELLHLERTAGGIKALPLWIDDRAALSVDAIAHTARRLQRQHGIGLVVVDYLQLAMGSKRREYSRVLEIGEITQGLKALAKQMGVPVLVLSQLSRLVEGREDKRPVLSDLRESGAIEQDADVVMFVYREEYYLDRARPPEPENMTDKEATALAKWATKKKRAQNVAEILVAKQRNGPIGMVRLRFDAPTATFSSLAQLPGEKRTKSEWWIE